MEEQLNGLTNSELIALLCAVRDKLKPKSIQHYRIEKDIAYNTVRAHIDSGKLEAFNIDGTLYIPDNLKD
jgi:hypothetical protein